MQNSTYSSTFTVTGYGEMTSMKYLYCVCALIGYMMILFTNSVIIAVVILQSSLHKPMYIFLCTLCVNGMYGATALFPKLIVDFLSDIQTVSHIGCLVQVYCIHTYIEFELMILAVMAFDRYVCICNPLRYNSIMVHSTVLKLIIAGFLYDIVVFTTIFALTLRLPLCGSTIKKIYCDNWSVVSLSCIDTSVNNIFGLFITIANVMLSFFFILISYVKILIVCVHAARETRAKALQTCTPHLISLMNFIIDINFEIFLHRFELKGMPHSVRVIMSVQFLIVPPLLNPILYGFKMTEIKSQILKLISSHKTSTV